MDPKVSFVVPCYKLAHFLGDCVNSILSQTYGDFEALIMDDCSPDDTTEIAKQFKDPRVIHIRNEKNLGFVHNLNKGIEHSRGRYLWLISADDCLRSQNVLQRYIDLLEKNPQVGYVFCPAMTLKDGEEVGVEEVWKWPGNRDRILSGHEVVRRSAYKCALIAPTCLARKECHMRAGGYPVDLPRTGDWYLWAAFAMTYDVGYFAEPMVYYRRHGANMDKVMAEEQPSFFFEQEMMVRWAIKKEAEKAGIKGVSSDLNRSLADVYTRRLVDKEVKNWRHSCSWDVATQEIRNNTSSEEGAEEILRLIRADWPRKLALGYARAAAGFYNLGQLDQAVITFRDAIKSNPWSIKIRVYLMASRLEQLLGIRLVPWLKSLKNSLLLSLRRFIRRYPTFSSYYYYVDE